jgi:uncharacterized protein (TIGR02598 family)
MKPLLFRRRRSTAHGGFNLVEATLSLGLLSFGFLALAPLLAVGLKTARLTQDNRGTALIAQSLMEEAKQGTLSAGTAYFDFQGNPINSPQAAYSAQSTLLPVTGSATLIRLTLRITPLGAPDRARTYAAVFSATQ